MTDSADILSILLPYQRRWVQDQARWKIGLWARQTGKSFSTAAEAVLDCVLRRTTWVCLSAGERQALEWMRKAQEWAEAVHIAVEDYQEIRDSVQALLKVAETRWPNGSRILALPANPATARGYTANIILDEFAFQEDPDAIWRAVYPSITNPLRGELRARVVSTPNGRNNRFADLWFRAGPKWSRHKVAIQDAAAAGLPIDVEELREQFGDPEAFAQEYECQFLDSSAVLLPYDLLAQIESPEATATSDPNLWSANRASRRYGGVDFGRSRDLTVMWTVELLGDVLYTIEVLELRGKPTPEQVRLLSPRIERCRLVALDYTGPGVGLGDYLVDRFGAYDPARHRFGRVQLVKFSRSVVCEIFSHLRLAAERLRIRVPADRTIREDLHSVYRVSTPGGVTYRAPHTRDGHADRATALALALRAYETVHAASGALQPAAVTVGARRGVPRIRPAILRTMR